jgi:hypothetical protein
MVLEGKEAAKVLDALPPKQKKIASFSSLVQGGAEEEAKLKAATKPAAAVQFRMQHPIQPPISLSPRSLSDSVTSDLSIEGSEDCFALGSNLTRQYFYNPESPDFSALQQICWAVVIGIVMGIYTAFWKHLIDGCIEVVWVKIPEVLLEMNTFTDAEGSFPLCKLCCWKY